METGLTIHNIYRLKEKISSDWISDTYLAHKLDENEKIVTVKLLKSNAISKRTEDIIRFRQELNSISKLDHPGIVKIFEIGEVIDFHFIVMEYLESKTLSEILTEPIPLEHSMDIIIRICRVLEYLHGENIIHRDLNPGSILMSNGEIKLCNFGLTHIREFSDMIHQDDITETFGYMSPEMSGLAKWSVDERSDLYSAGVIFYRMLTGTMPFESDEISSMIHKHMAAIPSSPASLTPDLPVMLDKIIMKLLEKEPDKRYQSAKGLLSDMDKILKGEDDFIPDLDDKIAKLHYRTSLIGRVKEQQKLEEMFNHARNGTGSLCFITGEAGIGKTRLVEELKGYIYSQGGIFIDGKCSVHSSKTPYEPFKDTLSAYIANFKNYSSSRKKGIIRDLRNEFGKLGEIILRLNPEMHEILGDCPPLVTLGTVRESIRFNSVIGQLFKKISDLEEGLVILIDDLHWTDEGSLKLITEIMDDIENHPLMFIGTYRDDEISDAHNLLKFLDTVKTGTMSTREIHLDTFDLEKMNGLVSGLLIEPEENTRHISELILQKSKGNLFFAIEILKHMVEEKVLSHGDKRWEFDAHALDTFGISGSIVDIILKRVKLLNENEKDILSYAAVIGAQFDMKLLFTISVLDNTQVVRIIDKAIQLNLLVDLPVQGRIGFAHDRIRDAFYYDIEDEKRKSLHLAASAAIEKNADDTIDDRVFDLAYHYIEGGDKDKSVEYAYPAGLKAKENFANEDALQYFRKTLELIEKSSSETNQLEIICRNEIGDIYTRIGEYDRAIEIFNEILPSVEGNYIKTKIYSQLSEIYYRKGDWTNCEEYGRRGLKLLGEKLPVNKISVIPGIIKELTIHILHSLFPGIFVRQKMLNNEIKEYAELASRFANPLLRTYILIDVLKFIRFILKILNMAESKIGNKSEDLGSAMGGYASFLMSIPLFKRAIICHNRALKMKEEFNDYWGIADSCQFLGYCYQWKAEYGTSIEYFTRSADTFKEIGDIKEYHMVLNGLILDYLITGDYKNAKILLDHYSETVHKVRGQYGIVTSHLYSSWYSLDAEGDLEKAETYAILSKEMSFGIHEFHYCVTLIRLGMIQLQKGDPLLAIEYLEKARRLHESNNFLKAYVVDVYVHLLKAYINDFTEREQDLSPAERRKYLKRIKRLARTALRKTKNWATYYGGALCLKGKYCALIGSNKKADGFFLKSIDWNKKIGRKFELARSFYQYGLFLTQTGNSENSRKNLELAYQIFSEVGAKLYIERLRSLLGIRDGGVDSSSIQKLVYKEKLSSIHNMSQKIIRIKDKDELLNSVLTKVLEITFARSTYLFLGNELDELTLRASKSILESEEKKYSWHIVEEVYKSGNHTITADEGEEGTIISVPLKLDDTIIGVCYCVNPSSGQFTERDVDLLYEFLFPEISEKIDIALNRKPGASDEQEIKRKITPATEEKIQKAISFLEKNFSSQISREGLASKLDIAPDNLGRYFKLLTGKKINEYINGLRIDDALKKLRNSNQSIIEIAYSVGFESLSTFNRVFFKLMHTTPIRYRKNKK